MTKRVQLPPPSEEPLPSFTELSKGRWVCFPNGKRRRKAPVDDHLACSHQISIRKQLPISVTRICGSRWKFENENNDSIQNCESKISGEMAIVECNTQNPRKDDPGRANERQQYDDKLILSCLKPDYTEGSLSTQSPAAKILNDVSTVSNDSRNEFRTVISDVGGDDVVILEQFSAEELISDTFFCDELNEDIFCPGNEDADDLEYLHTIEAFSDLNLKDKFMNASDQNNFCHSALFDVTANVICYVLPAAAQAQFEETDPECVDALDLFRKELLDILRLLWEGSTIFEVINEILAFWRRIIDDSSESKFQNSCARMVRTIAAKLDEALYHLTEKCHIGTITKGTIVRVYDAVLYRWWVGRMYRYDHGKGAVVTPLYHLYTSEEFPILPVIAWLNYQSKTIDCSRFAESLSITLQEYVKLPSYFGCSFDFSGDSFLCKGDDLPRASTRKVDELSHTQNMLVPSEPTVDDKILEHKKAILQKVEIENSKELSDMRFYFLVCRGFPKHGVRGGKSYWTKACFKDSKFSQKLQQHAKYGKFAELVLKQYSKLSSDEFDSLMQRVWMVPEIDRTGIEIKTVKELLKLNVFARMLSLNRRGRKEQKSKTRQNNQSCTLCSSSVSLLSLEGSNSGVQCSQCKVIICSVCIQSSHVETAPRIFSDFHWTCSRCYQDNEECTNCESGGNLVTCDGCNRDHCFPCAGLTEEIVPEGDWFCKPCREKTMLLGSRVRVLCSDGEKYEGVVSLWDRRQREFKISLDCGDILYSPLSEDSWDIEFINGRKKPA